MTAANDHFGFSHSREKMTDAQGHFVLRHSREKMTAAQGQLDSVTAVNR